MLPFPRGEFFVPMEVYVDESGIHGGSKRCVVAGYAGGRQKLRALEAQWIKTLIEFKVPIEVGFHAKTFFKKSAMGNRFGVYSDWSDSQAYDFIETLTRAIHSQELKAVGGVVTVDKFNSLTNNFRRYITGGNFDERSQKWITSGAPLKPYFFPFNQVVIGACRFADHGVTADFIFDRQDSFSGFALQRFRDMKLYVDTKTAQHLGGIAFYSRHERVCLQAADLLSHCLYHVDAYRRDTDSPALRHALHRIADCHMYVKDLDIAITELQKTYPPALRRLDENESGNAEIQCRNEHDFESRSAEDQAADGRGKAGAGEAAQS